MVVNLLSDQVSLEKIVQVTASASREMGRKFLSREFIQALTLTNEVYKGHSLLKETDFAGQKILNTFYYDNNIENSHLIIEGEKNISFKKGMVNVIFDFLDGSYAYQKYVSGIKENSHFELPHSGISSTILVPNGETELGENKFKVVGNIIHLLDSGNTYLAYKLNDMIIMKVLSPNPDTFNSTLTRKKYGENNLPTSTFVFANYTNHASKEMGRIAGELDSLFLNRGVGTGSTGVDLLSPEIYLDLRAFFEYSGSQPQVVDIIHTKLFNEFRGLRMVVSENEFFNFIPFSKEQKFFDNITSKKLYDPVPILIVPSDEIYGKIISVLNNKNLFKNIIYSWKSQKTIPIEDKEMNRNTSDFEKILTHDGNTDAGVRTNSHVHRKIERLYLDSFDPVEYFIRIKLLENLRNEPNVPNYVGQKNMVFSTGKPVSVLGVESVGGYPMAEKLEAIYSEGGKSFPLKDERKCLEAAFGVNQKIQKFFDNFKTNKEEIKSFYSNLPNEIIEKHLKGKIDDFFKFYAGYNQISIANANMEYRERNWIKNVLLMPIKDESDLKESKNIENMIKGIYKYLKIQQDDSTKLLSILEEKARNGKYQGISKDNTLWNILVSDEAKGSKYSIIDFNTIVNDSKFSDFYWYLFSPGSEFSNKELVSKKDDVYNKFKELINKSGIKYNDNELKDAYQVFLGHSIVKSLIDMVVFSKRDFEKRKKVRIYGNTASYISDLLVETNPKVIDMKKFSERVKKYAT